jgi:hypothetical protein
MICDLYKVLDQHLEPDESTPDLVSDLVTVLPPRGHGFHKLDRWELTYRSRPDKLPFLA